MNRVLQPIGLLAAIALVVYAGVLLLADPEADEVVEDAIADGRAHHDGEREAIESSRERLRRAARGLAMSPEARVDGRDDRDGPNARSVDASAVPYGSGEVDPTNAREGFSYAMSRVEEIAESRRRLSQDEWDALYREANDAFSALSMVIDPHDDLQLAELETAHKRLQLGLRKVRVDGQKLAN
jgi:L-arabinose isomerase